MDRAVDPKYRFHFTNETGRSYSRKCYWENLYAFIYGNDKIVAAARVVPFSNMNEALYTAFKGHRANTLTQHLLPEALEYPQLNVFEDGPQIQTFADNIAALVPQQTSQIPEELLEKTEAQIEEAASRIMIGQGFEGGLGSFASSETTPFLARDEPDNPFQTLAQEEDEEDKALIQLSVQIDAAIKSQMRDTLQNNLTETALVRHGDIEFDIATKLYTNPRYLAFVRRLIKAKGSYASPVVRDFLRFYARCLNMKFVDHIRHSDDDPDILRKRVESTLGHEKGGSYHYLDYHDLTILGRATGIFDPDLDDPDKTTYSFKLSPNTDTQDLHLQEIRDPIQRLMIRKFVEHTFNTHHNIKTIQYIDETKKRKIPIVKHLPDPVEKALQSGIEALEDWLDSHGPQ